MYKSSRIFLSAILMMLAQYAIADDFGVWLEAEADKKLSKKWSVGVNAEWKSSEKMSMGVSTTYKPVKWLKLQAGYDLQDIRYDGGLTSSGKKYNNPTWHLRHRLSASATGQLTTGRWKFSLRERWTYTYAPSFTCERTNVNENSSAYGTTTTVERSSKAKNTLRSRLTAEYSLSNCPLTPYASVEMFNAWNVEKMRYSVGTEYEFGKQHAVKLYYLYQDVFDDDDSNKHVIGAGYKFSF